MAPRAAKARARRSWPQRLLLGTGTVLALACTVAAVGLGYVAWKLSRVERLGDVGDLVQAADGEPQNFLVVGSDSRESVDPDDPDAGAFLNGDSGGRRSDTIVLVRVDPRAGHLTMLSLPRDLWVPIAGTDETNRINTAYGRGRQVLIDTIEEQFGIPVHHYVEVDFAGFKGLVDALDGVPLWFEQAARDEHSGLDVGAGCVVLDPDQALAFARSRHYEYLTDDGWQLDPSGDHGRISRQQAFIFRALDRARDRGLTNPVTLNRLIDVALDNVSVDTGLSDGDILALARRFRSIQPSAITTLRLPVEEDVVGEAFVLRLVTAEAQDELNVFRGLPPGALAPEAVTVRVLNGSGTAHQATDASEALADRGFVVSGVGDADEPVTGTEIHHAPDHQPAAAYLARWLEGGARLVADASVDPTEVVLTTGPDFGGVRTAAGPPVVADDTLPPTTDATAADPSEVAVRVMNGTHVEGQAADAADALEGEGFTVLGTGDWEELVDETTVYFPPGEEAAAMAVADHLVAGAALVEDPAMGEGGVVLVTGADWDGVGVPVVGGDEPELSPPTPTTSTSVPGVVPGVAPPGIDCG